MLKFVWSYNTQHAIEATVPVWGGGNKGKNDHELAECADNDASVLRVIKPQPCRDLNYLFTRQEMDDHGNTISTERMSALEAAGDDKLEELNYSTSNDNTTDMYVIISRSGLKNRTFKGK